jgi:thiol-disulfide isomerase/thioredoxin
MSRRLARGLAAAVVALALVACSGGGDPSAGGATSPPDGPTTGTSSTGTGTGTGVAAAGCPTLDRAQPLADGLPDLELPCLGEGASVNLADLRGVPTVLNVWAAWCTNCDREMPLFADAVERAGERVRFFGVHYKAPRDYGLRSEVDFGVPFPSVHDEDGDLVVDKLRAYAPPQTLFVTADGVVAGRKVGEIASQRELDRLVGRYLGVRL